MLRAIYIDRSKEGRMHEDPLRQRLVKVLYPADPDEAETRTEAIWVLPIVGDENEGTGIILNDSVSGKARFQVGDIATWISASPATQKAEIVASRRTPFRTDGEFLSRERTQLAQGFHAENEALRMRRVKTMAVLCCEVCGNPGVGRLLPDEVWRAIIPAEHQSKVLCDSCIDRFEKAAREGARAA